MGNGKQIKCENEEELFKFFLDSEDGAFMWRGHEDFSVIANAYQFKITIITVHGMDDDKPEQKLLNQTQILQNILIYQLEKSLI